jgi:hypothetical protein
LIIGACLASVANRPVVLIVSVSHDGVVFGTVECRLIALRTIDFGTSSAAMSVYHTKEFARFSRKERVSTKALRQAAADVAQGHFNADLGGGVFKQRIA